MARKIWIIALVSLVISLGQYSYAHADTPESKPAPVTYIYESKSVYALYGAATKDSEGIVLGDAVAINQHALATTCHVALAGNIISVRINGQTKIAKVLYHYNDSDICIVGVEDAQFTPAKIRPSQLVQIGEEVAAITNPQDNSSNLIKGKISNKYDKDHPPQGNQDPRIKHILETDKLAVLQTDAPLSHSLGGSGLFDQYGNLIGITTEDDANGNNAGYTIPTELILKLFPPSNREGVTQVNLTTSPTEPPKILAETHAPAQASPELAPDPNSPISQIGRFGDDSIGVYKTGDECFLSMSGTNSQKAPESLALWFPNDPSYLYVFPHATRTEDAYQFFLNYEDQDLNLKETDSYLNLDNETFALLGDAQLNSNYPILVRKMNINVASVLTDIDSFDVQTKDANPTTIHYGLDGFEEALDAERAFCER